MTAAPGKQSWTQGAGLRVGAIGSLLFLLLSFTSIAWTPHPIEALNVGAALQDPGMLFWFGSDHLGRDVLSLLMKGILTSFVVAAVAVVIGAIIGVPLGLAAAVWGGPVAWLLDRVSDFLITFPALIIAILIAAVFGSGAIVVMIAFGIFSIPAFARVTREGWLRLHNRDYVAAARMAGMGTFEIARRHIAPSVAGLLLVQALTMLALGIIAEASLSYVGLGAQAPASSLGLMLKEAQPYAALKPMLAIIPGIAIVLIVIALNLTADGFREQIDPKLRRAGAANGPA